MLSAEWKVSSAVVQSKIQNLKSKIWQALEEVKDPEIPVVSLLEMGIVRGVDVGEDGRVTVTMTPTFAGCPALLEMERLIVEKLAELGAEGAVQTILYPPWTSDWITAEGREKLRAFGLAPPAVHGGNINVTFFEPVACPRCRSTQTTLQNAFGSTLCRAIYTCHTCQETFEQFKAL